MKLYTSLLKVQGELGALKKDESNPFFKSQYVSLNAVREAVVPALTKAGLVLLQPTVFADGKQFVRTTIVHAESGESVISDTEVISKSANDAQQVGSGISYARRYGLMSLLCLAAEDDDGNSASGKATTSVASKPAAAAPAASNAASAKPSFKKPTFVKKTETTVEEEL